MKLYKIYDAIITTQHNTPCKLAVFTDDALNFKVFEKVLWRTGKCSSWWRNINFDHYKSVKEVEQSIIDSTHRKEQPVEPCAAYKSFDRKTTKYVLLNMSRK